MALDFYFFLIYLILYSGHHIIATNLATHQAHCERRMMN